MLEDTQKKNLSLLLLSATILLMAPVAAVSASSISIFGITLPGLCLLRLFTGVECPGCGLTRALIFALHGEFRSSLQMHLWGVPLAALLLFQIPYRIYLLYANKESVLRMPDFLRPWFSRLLLLSLLIPWAIRLTLRFF